MNTYQVKRQEYQRKKPRNRLLVRGGVIVDPLLEVAVSDPIWRQWFDDGAPTADYVPFQAEPVDEPEQEFRHSEGYHAESIRLFVEATT